jgi:GWxTD domain-containing protein
LIRSNAYVMNNIETFDDSDQLDSLDRKPLANSRLDMIISTWTKNMKKTTLILALIVAGYSQIRAQDNPGFTDELARRPFYVDYAAFADTTLNTINLEVYYKIYSSILAYQKWGDRFKADYSVDITINQKGKQITGTTNDGSLTADNYKATISKDDFVINKVSFKLPPDNYELSITLNDPIAGILAKPRDINLKLKDFGKKTPYISSIEFIHEAGGAEDDSAFIKSGVKIVPSVSRVYGEEEPELKLFYWIYGKGDFKGEYLASYEIRNGNKTVLTDSSLFPATGANTSRLERIRVDNLITEEYTIYLNNTSPGNNLELKGDDDFIIGWSILGLVKNDWKTAVAQLRYIATHDQMKKLSDASPESRLALWSEFWKAKDPSPSTPDNELKDEYYKRIRYADLNFGNFGRDGWRTDMGMVYITYGPPDEIERHPFDIDAKPYQVWYYYTMKLIFRFVDVNGYGEFELVYPYDGDIRKLH